jgi:hypothetical protein
VTHKYLARHGPPIPTRPRVYETKAQWALARANQLHLIDLKKAGHTARATELRIKPSTREPTR